MYVFSSSIISTRTACLFLASISFVVVMLGHRILLTYYAHCSVMSDAGVKRRTARLKKAHIC